MVADSREAGLNTALRNLRDAEDTCSSASCCAAAVTYGFPQRHRPVSLNLPGSWMTPSSVATRR